MAVAERLNSILDAEDESDVERAPDASAGAVNGASTDAITSGLEATVASLTAKLRVYQTQFSEYASEKSVVDSELADPAIFRPVDLPILNPGCRQTQTRLTTLRCAVPRRYCLFSTRAGCSRRSRRRL